MSSLFQCIYEPGKGFSKTELKATPALSGNEVLIKPKYVGICGTDLYLMKKVTTPLHLGHEWIGEVIACGPQVTEFSVGDTVTGTGHFACGKCPECLEEKSNLCSHAVHFSSDKIGALRSQFIAPDHQLHKISSPMAKAQVLHEIFAVGEQAYSLLEPHLKNSSSVLILGAGPIGLSIAETLKSYQIAVTLVEKNMARVQRAHTLGHKAVSLGEALLSSDFKSVASLIVDTTNDYSEDLGAFRFLPHFAKKEFTALIVGKYIQPQSLSAQYNSMAGQLIWMRGVSNKTMKKSLPKWSSQLESLAETFITQTYSVDELDEAFRTAQDKTQSLKVVIAL